MSDLTEFASLPVVEFPARGTWEERLEQIRKGGADPRDPASTAWRLRTSEHLHTIPEDKGTDYFARFLSEVDPGQLTALVIGEWGYASDGGLYQAADLLVEHADALPNLRSVFFGDITFDECELSWISQPDLGPLVAAFPRLEELTVKGADGMEGRLGLHVSSHASLRSLTLRSGGLPGRVVREVASSGLPALEHLELWLGMEEYGGSASPQDLAPVLSGEAFPRLKYLGVRNAEKWAEWVPELAGAPVVKHLEVLDLSLGILTDQGARELVDRAEAFSGLRKLDLHHHFMSEEMVERVRAAFAGTGVELDLDEGRDDEDEDYDEDEEPYYYTAASE
ncbi:STM4015 family protein [Nocardiopsis sp. HUAS JQ3]|uniref:STM4015 family protein n=1 Tax=Nocardiopsis sp. HUAS JQ3 TaxID=3061629 RepID=UPI0023A95148|nr:STM4015 family protein [Nocardiopsis sp. HUAS JQ3]WDZ91856.1 STM4015 family protein [Nocardiopsis sp. HUAS JQ3]